MTQIALNLQPTSYTGFSSGDDTSGFSLVDDASSGNMQGVSEGSSLVAGRPLAFRSSVSAASFMDPIHRSNFQYTPGAINEYLTGQPTFTAGRAPVTAMFTQFPNVVDDEAPVHSRPARQQDHENWRDAMATGVGANFVGQRWSGAMMRHYLGNSGQDFIMPLKPLEETPQLRGVIEPFTPHDREAYEKATQEAVRDFFKRNPDVDEVTFQGPWILQRAQGKDTFQALGSFWLGGAGVFKRVEGSNGQPDRIEGQFRMQGFDYYNFRLDPAGKPLPTVGGGTIPQSALVDLATHGLAKPFNVHAVEAPRTMRFGL